MEQPLLLVELIFPPPSHKGLLFNAMQCFNADVMSIMQTITRADPHLSHLNVLCYQAPLSVVADLTGVTKHLRISM